MVIQECKIPAQWTNESEPALSPIHILGPGNRGKDLRQNLLKNLGQRLTWSSFSIRDVGTLGRIDDLEIGNRNASLSGKPFNRLGGVLVGIVSDRLAGTQDHFITLGLTVRQSFQPEGQPARRGEPLKRLKADLAFLKKSFTTVTHLVQSLGDHTSWHLFQSQLKQELVHISLHSARRSSQQAIEHER